MRLAGLGRVRAQGLGHEPEYVWPLELGEHLVSMALVRPHPEAVGELLEVHAARR